MNEEELLGYLKSGYKAAQGFCKPLWDRRIRNFNLYIGNIPNRPKAYSNYNVPYVATLFDNVWPLLVNRIPEHTVAARNDRDRPAAGLMKELLQYTFDVNSFDFTFLMQEKESMMFADAWLKVCWEYMDKKYDHVSLTPLNSFDVIPHPRKIDLDDNYPMYIRSEMTKKEMIEHGWDKNVIDTLGKSKLKTPQYRREQLASLGYTPAQGDEKVENPDDLYDVVETWGMMDLSFGKDKNANLEMGLVVIANDEKAINTKPPFQGDKKFQSPYNHGKIPLAQLRFNPYPHMLLSESFIDPLADMQAELNKLENEKVDNYRRRNNPPMKVKRGGNVDVNSLKYVQSLPWMMDSVDDVEPYILPDLASSIESQQNMIRSVMQNRSGANDVLLVSDASSVQGGDTALGASIANENTKMRFRPQAKLINIYFERVGELTIALYQDERYFDQEKAIAIADEEGNYYNKMINNKDIKGDLQFRAMDNSSLAQSNAARLQTLINLKEIYIQDGSINQEELDKGIFDAADVDFTKVKKGKDVLIADAVTQLKKLISLTQQPGFEEAPEAQKQQVLGQIDQLQAMIQEYQAQSPGGAAVAPQPSAEQVPTQGGLQ